VGYTTDFEGSFKLNRTLSSEHKAYLTAFSNTRRMSRNAYKTRTRPDPLRYAVNLKVGPEGAYFVGEEGLFGQGTDADDIINYNEPPMGQPGLWCQWEPNEDGTCIQWDGGEKFYHYIEWLEYLIEHFLKPWKYRLNGRVTWSGELHGDIGTIIVENNCVRTVEGAHLRTA